MWYTVPNLDVMYLASVTPNHKTLVWHICDRRRNVQQFDPGAHRQATKQGTAPLAVCELPARRERSAYETEWVEITPSHHQRVEIAPLPIALSEWVELAPSRHERPHNGMLVAHVAIYVQFA